MQTALSDEKRKKSASRGFLQQRLFREGGAFEQSRECAITHLPETRREHERKFMDSLLPKQFRNHLEFGVVLHEKPSKFP